MEHRINIAKTIPAAYKAMAELEKYLATTRISPLHQDLIRIRASQLNGCAYCVDKHSRDILQYGETQQRINALTVWRDTPFFTEEEKSILALTEEMTFIHQRVSNATYQQAARLFDNEYLAQIMMAVIVINAWNRIGVATEMQPVKA